MATLRKSQTVMHLPPGSSVIRWARYTPTDYGVEQYITDPGTGEYQLRAQIEAQHWDAFCMSEPSAASAQDQDDQEAARAIGSEG